jgi:hypothetical protein
VNPSQNQLKALFAKELEKYSNKRESFKAYSLCMKEINEWLKKREK